MIAPKLHSQPLIAKQAQIEAMPVELTQLAWTCRSPVWSNDTATECGRCKTCKLMAPIRANLAQQGLSLSPVTLTALP